MRSIMCEYCRSYRMPEHSWCKKEERTNILTEIFNGIKVEFKC